MFRIENLYWRAFLIEKSTMAKIILQEFNLGLHWLTVLSTFCRDLLSFVTTLAVVQQFLGAFERWQTFMILFTYPPTDISNVRIHHHHHYYCCWGVVCPGGNVEWWGVIKSFSTTKTLLHCPRNSLRFNLAKIHNTIHLFLTKDHLAKIHSSTFITDQI